MCECSRPLQLAIVADSHAKSAIQDQKLGMVDTAVRHEHLPEHADQLIPKNGKNEMRWMARDLT